MKKYTPITLCASICIYSFLTSCLTICAFNNPTCYLEEAVIESEKHHADLQEQYTQLYGEVQELKVAQEAQIKQTEETDENYIEEEIIDEEIEENRWSITLTDDEVDLLARIVMLEAGGESSRGQEAVVEVIFNRMYHEKFPDTLEDVLSQKRQFSTWKNRNIKAATPTEKVYESIDNVLSGQTDILPFKTVYFARSAQNKRIETTIGNHVFCNY